MYTKEQTIIVIRGYLKKDLALISRLLSLDLDKDIKKEIQQHFNSCIGTRAFVNSKDFLTFSDENTTQFTLNNYLEIEKENIIKATKKEKERLSNYLVKSQCFTCEELSQDKNFLNTSMHYSIKLNDKELKDFCNDMKSVIDKGTIKNKYAFFQTILKKRTS